VCVCVCVCVCVIVMYIYGSRSRVSSVVLVGFVELCIRFWFLFWFLVLL